MGTMSITASGKVRLSYWAARTRNTNPTASTKAKTAPITLGNMRGLGLRSLAMHCELCQHLAVLIADDPGCHRRRRGRGHAVGLKVTRYYPGVKVTWPRPWRASN
jgi:hypothetical protein